MAEASRYHTFEEALDEAVELLSKRFEQPDQSAAVQLANVLYGMQERERFELRDTQGGTNVPYRG